MATDNPGKTISLIADADYSAVEYPAVKMNGAKSFVVATAQTDEVIGVLQNRPKQGQAGTIMVSGITKVKTGANVAAVGALIVATTAGAVTVGTTGGKPFAKSLQTSTNGDIVPVLLQPAPRIV